MFKDDLELEEKFYNKIFKKWLNSRGNDSIFIRYNSDNIIYETLQKKNDIDIILDNGFENVVLSLKTVRKKYNSIFFETISNCTKRTKGWGYYSRADYIIYNMGNFETGFDSIAFKIDNVLKLNIEKYSIGYGKTFDKDNNLLYKTEDRIIPIQDIERILLFRNRL